MALHKKAEFARKCGQTPGNLSNYIRRKKVIVRPDGMIDDADLVNAEYLKHRLALQKEGNDGETPGKEPKTAKMTRKPGKTPDSGQAPSQGGELYELDKRRKESAIELSEYEKQIKNFQILRMQGRLIPTDLVKSAISNAFRHTNTGFKNLIESLLTDVAAKYRLNANELAEERGKATKAINEQIHRNVDNFIRDIDNIVLEYSQAKNGI